MNHFSRSIALIIAIVGCQIGQGTALAEVDASPASWLTADFGLFGSDGKSEIAPRIALQLGPKNWESIEREAWVGSYYLMAGIEGLVVHVWDSKLDNEPSKASVGAGAFWNLSKMNVATSLPGQPGQESNPVKYDYGALGAKVHVAVDADDDGKNANLAGGAQLVYIPLSAFDKNIFPPPSVLLVYEYVKPQGDEAREQAGAVVSDFPRLRLALLWNWDFGSKLGFGNTFLQQLALQLRYSYAKEFNQPALWKDHGFDEYDQLSLRLRFLVPVAQRQSFGIREIYAEYSSGRQIAHSEDDERILLGVTLQ